MKKRGGAKTLDVPEMRELFADPRTWTGLGLVVKRQGEDSHFEIVDGDVLVEVDLMPEGTPLLCRLGSLAGGAGRGLWRIPPVGTEVALVIPGGDLSETGGDPLIVGVLSTGTIDADLNGDILLLVNDKAVKIKSTGEDVIVDAPASGKKVLLGGGTRKKVARMGDDISHGTLAFNFAGGSGGATLSVTYTPGDGSSAQSLPTGSGTITLNEEIAQGSNKVESE